MRSRLRAFHSLVPQAHPRRSSLMRSYLRLTTLVASLLASVWFLPGCSPNEGTGGKMDSSAMPTGKMDGGAMDKGKMRGGAIDSGTMDTGKMDGGPMGSGKVAGGTMGTA